MGRVYLAEHVKMGRQCAIKVLHPAMAADAEAIVAGAGLRVKVIRPHGWTTLEYGIGRITLQIDDEERVIEAHAG
jgi:serine/threonine protein kinase